MNRTGSSVRSEGFKTVGTRTRRSPIPAAIQPAAPGETFRPPEARSNLAVSAQSKAQMVKDTQLIMTIVDSLAMCSSMRFVLGPEALLNLYRAVTGVALEEEEAFFIAERINNLERLFNLVNGARAADDRLPERFKEEAADQGPAEGKTVDVEPMVQDFYRSMGWNDEGIPSEKTLKSLGLPEVPPLDL